MSFFAKLLGGGAVSAVEGIANVVDKFVETPEEKALAKQIMIKMAMQPGIAQDEVNKIEAQHRSIFVAGWRPFIGWVCGFALLYAFIIRDWIMWLSPTTAPPMISMDQIMTVLMGMLGLGGLRTIEKLQGKTK